MDFREAFILALKKNGPVHMTKQELSSVINENNMYGDFHIVSDGHGGLLYSAITDERIDAVVQEKISS